MAIIRLTVLATSFCGVGYLALRSSPNLAEVAWLPRWLSEWADGNGVLRNAPAFAGLYLIGVLCIGRKHRFWVLGGVVIMSAAFEVAQLWLPTRFPGWDDILASWIGTLTGFAAYSLGWQAFNLCSKSAD